MPLRKASTRSIKLYARSRNAAGRLLLAALACGCARPLARSQASAAQQPELASAAVALATHSATARASQAAQKRPLSWADFPGWRSISSPTLSLDGQWLAYAYMPARGDGQIVVRQLPSSPTPEGRNPRSYRLNAGELPPPAFPQGPSANDRPPPPRKVEHLFTGDSQFLLSLVFPSAQEQLAERLQQPRASDPLRGQVSSTQNLKQPLGLIDLSAGRSELVPAVWSVQASLAGSWIAYLHEPSEQELGPGRSSWAGSSPRRGAVAAAPQLAQRRLVLRELRSETARGSWGRSARRIGGFLRGFDYVSEYALSRDARTLLFISDSPRASRSGLYAYKPGASGEPLSLFRTGKAGAVRLSTLTWDAQQEQAAFLIHYHDGQQAVGLWRRGEPSATIALSAAAPGIPADMQLGEYSSLSFSGDGQKLYVGLVPKAAAASAASAHAEASADPLEQAFPELWAWDDALIKPRRNILAESERRRSYPGILDLNTRRFSAVASPRLPEVRFNEDGLWALAFDEAPYLRLRDYDAIYADLYAIDTRSGARRLIAKKLRGASGDEGLPSLYFSPQVGQRQAVAYFADGHWWAADLASGRVQNLTAELPVSFAYEEHDKLEPAPPYGWGGWLVDGRSFIVHDRYDLWQLSIAPPASVVEESEEWETAAAPPARNLTASHGRHERIILRLQDITPLRGHSEEGSAAPPPPLWLRGIDPAQPLILRGEHEDTRDSGFFRQALAAPDAPGAAIAAPPPPIEPLIWGERNYRYLDAAKRVAAAAKGASGEDTARGMALLFSASRFDEFPDLWVSNGDFAAAQRVSDGGTQLAPFNWGAVPELIEYRNGAGTPLKGLLYKPPGFDPGRQYPIIVYLYERLSSARHAFFAPSFGANINFPHYISNGYLVYLVDIAYELGAPGPSALDSVNAALDALQPRGFVDAERIGLQGSSWGGYQVAYIVTHSGRFRAAVAGSPVGNMSSAYAGIRWRSGRARLFQYEQSQSRIGVPLSEAPERYIANSPVFAAHRLSTPLLLVHNSGDGVVPWSQSTELFLTLRRHQRPVWLVNYPHETHEIVRYANRRDFQQRMWAFFEHHLRGTARPEWMQATDK